MTNAKVAYDFLTGQGLSREGAAGVVGNLVAESGVNPTVTGDSGTSFGIAQWHKDRWDNLKTFAAAGNMNVNLLGTQLAFLKREMSQSGLWGRLKGIRDVNEAARIVCVEYERPKDAASKVPKRQEIARAVLANNGEYSGASSGNSGGVPVTVGPDVGGITGVPDAVANAIRSGLSSASSWATQVLKVGGFGILSVVLIALGLVILLRKTAASAALSVATDGVSSAIRRK